MNSPPINDKLIDASGLASRPWTLWFSQLVNTSPNSGSTANRPVRGLYIGRFYFDETIGKPIWLKSINPVVWVLATGVAA